MFPFPALLAEDEFATSRQNFESGNVAKEVLLYSTDFSALEGELWECSVAHIWTSLIFTSQIGIMIFRKFYCFWSCTSLKKMTAQPRCFSQRNALILPALSVSLEYLIGLQNYHLNSLVEVQKLFSLANLNYINMNIVSLFFFPNYSLIFELFKQS